MEQGIDVTACMRDGELVPTEMLQALLEDTILSIVRAGQFRILLDGFPRSIDQAKLFEASVSAGTPSIVIAMGRQEDMLTTL